MYIHWVSIFNLKWLKLRELPGSPVVKICFHFPGSVPGQGTKISQAVWHSQEKEKYFPLHPESI